MTSTITRMLNLGRAWTVVLDCGCRLKGLTAEQLKEEQLFIGKRVACPTHGPKAKHLATP